MRKPIGSVDEFVEKALEGEFDELDEQFYNCDPNIPALLEQYLERYRDRFVQIV